MNIKLIPIEIYGSKINALLSRAAVRDLYDFDLDFVKKSVIEYIKANGSFILQKQLITFTAN